MPIPVPTPIATGYFDAAGSDYRQLTDQLYIADAGANTINALTAHTHVNTVLGTGYNAPSDIELSSDGIHAYVTENPGTLLKLSLTNLNRAAAIVVASGFYGIDQVALDETRGFAYVCEFTASQIQRVNLTTGVKTVVASATPSRIWTGITSVALPPPGPTPWNATVTGDPTSTHCAHSFFLYAWDRVINGWGFIHGPASYQKSITIML